MGRRQVEWRGREGEAERGKVEGGEGESKK